MKPNESKESKEQDKDKFGRQQSLLLARESVRKLKKGSVKLRFQTRKQDEVSIVQQQQLAERALPLLLARNSTRMQGKGKTGQKGREKEEQGAGGTAIFKLLQVLCTISRTCQSMDSHPRPESAQTLTQVPLECANNYRRTNRACDRYTRVL